MKILLLFLGSMVVGFWSYSQQSSSWTPVNESTITSDLFTSHIRPQAYKLFRLNESAIQTTLRTSSSLARASGVVPAMTISIPNAEGQLERFSVRPSATMDPALAARYPGIQSFAGPSLDHPGSIIRFDVSPRGFHGMILSADKPTVYIDPVKRNDQHYIVFSRGETIDYQQLFKCLTKEKASPARRRSNASGTTLRGADDGQLRTYRMALAASGEYASYFLDGTETNDIQRKTKVLAAMNTLLTRINGIYERDFGIRLQLVAGNDTLIFLNPATDPWTSEFNSQTQQTIDAAIGSANYDIGHLLHRGANNGAAGCVGCVCVNGSKGRGFTAHTTPEGDPFIVDYTSHEIGHQFGATHTFTFYNEGTGSNIEPGSGSTIMGYAGISGPDTDIQPHSDDYFHAKTIEQVTDYAKYNPAGTCATLTSTGNALPVANAGSDYVIPHATPFTLTGTASDADATDILTYTWEQYDPYGDGTVSIPSAMAPSGPQFRSKGHSTNPSRSFPQLSSVLSGANGNKWEALPAIARTLNFRFTVRDNHLGGGSNSSDDMQVTVCAAGPFAVTVPNTAVTWAPGSAQTISWSVNGTNNGPIHCTHVNILLSVDGGNSFPTMLVANTPNDGTEIIRVPATLTTQARVRIEAVNNIFFDISNANFTISGTPPLCAGPVGLTVTTIDPLLATVSWTAVANAASYNVEYKLSTVSTWSSAAVGSTESSVMIGGLVPNTTYDWRVRTNCASGASAYSSTQFTTPGIPPCINALESNDSRETATIVGTNATLSAAISSSTDVDWYTINVASAADLNIQLGNLAGDFDLVLYDHEGMELQRSQYGGTSPETIARPNVPAGTYYILVFGYGGEFSATTCYHLQIQTTYLVACAGNSDSGDNETIGHAVSIPLNTEINGRISVPGDQDYYSFTLTEPTMLTITLSNLPDDYDLRLYSSAQAILGTSMLGGTSLETINYVAAAGTYYVQVWGYNNAHHEALCYTLRVGTGTSLRNNGKSVSNNKPVFNLFPNPVASTLQVNIAGTSARSVIRVLDATGRLLMTKPVTDGTTPLDVQRYAQGVYMVIVTDEKGKPLYQQKFIKQ